jgi:hypothetical protein
MKATALIQSATASLAFALILLGCSENSTMSTAPGLSATLPTSNKAVSASPILAEERGDFLKTQLLPLPDETNQRPFGIARWERRNNRLKFSVEVQNVLTSGSHKVRLNGNGIGDVKIFQYRGELEIDTEAGHTVPTMKKNDVIEVLDPSGRLILKGVMQ